MEAMASACVGGAGGNETLVASGEAPGGSFFTGGAAGEGELISVSTGIEFGFEKSGLEMTGAGC